MSRCLIGGAILTGALAVFPAAPALADRADCSSHLEAAYSSNYHLVAKQLGKRSPGRNIRNLGVRRHKTVRDASCHELRDSLATLRALRAPTGGQGSGASAASTGGTGANLPACTWAPESGGSYNAYNPSSGAGGKYQIMPSTWRAYGGTGSPQTASPAEQDRVAARVYAGQGASAWTDC
jgi:Transglycosylase-like domain